MSGKGMYKTRKEGDFPKEISINFGGTTHTFVELRWAIRPETGKDPVSMGLRYGDNPHQAAAVYVPKGIATLISDMEFLKWAKNGPSTTNIEDLVNGYKIVSNSKLGTRGVAVMKHLNPSGVARRGGGESFTEVFRKAWNADPQAAFGSVVVTDMAIDLEGAREMTNGKFIEVICASAVSDEALEIFNSKENLRVIQISELGIGALGYTSNLPNIKILVDGSVVVQERYLDDISGVHQLLGMDIPTKRKPTMTEAGDLIDAWSLMGSVRSNGVVIWKDRATLAVGTGQQDRVTAIELAVAKAIKYGHDLNGAVLASDGFFPNEDNVRALKGISAVIQPGGSIKDDKIVAACDELNIALVRTWRRGFAHF